MGFSINPNRISCSPTEYHTLDLCLPVVTCLTYSSSLTQAPSHNTNTGPISQHKLPQLSIHQPKDEPDRTQFHKTEPHLDAIIHHLQNSFITVRDRSS